MILGSTRYRTNTYDDTGQQRRRERRRQSATATVDGMEAEMTIQQGSLPLMMKNVLRVSGTNTPNSTGPSDGNFSEVASTHSYGTKHDQARAILDVSSPDTTDAMKHANSGCYSELTTTFDDNLGSFGNMFDIHTYEAIEIYGIDIYTDMLTPVTFEIYTKFNAFKDDGGKEDISAWTLLIKGTANGGGEDKPTPVRGFKVLAVPTNSTMGFYVTLTTPDLRYRDIRAEMPDAMVGDVYTKNEDLEIRVGVSVADYPFAQAFFGKRSWSGTLHYVPDRICESNMPSSSPTVTGSLLPSSTPSLKKSSNPSVFPSFTPSLAESSKPSMVPSISPSLMPTVMETIISHLPSNPPSALPTTEPTRVEVDSSQCAEKGSIGLAMDGGTGAYGSMFTVTSHNSSVIITSISFHTDFKEGELTTQVFTKNGNFVGFEHVPDAWRQISESVLIGEGAGFRTQIPYEDFEAVNMQPHETRAFYITLTTADIRYSQTNLALGEPVAADEFLSVNAGAGLADYPFASKGFIYEPREFNGAVHFEAITECRPTGNVLYYFNVHHMRDLSKAELTQRVNSNVKATMETLFKTDLQVMDQTKNNRLQLEGTNTTVEGDSCDSISELFKCTSVAVNVTLKYDASTGGGVRWGDLKYTFLKFNEEVTLNLNFEFRSLYVGDLPVEQETTFSLESKTNVIELTANQAVAFENAITGFLEAPLKAQGITPLGAKVIGQELSRDEKEGRRYGRRRQLNNVRSINIATIITGEYRPPLEIDFDGVVRNAIGADIPALEVWVRRSDEYFVTTNSVKLADKVPQGADLTPKASSSEDFPIIPVLGGLGGLFLTSFLLIWCFVQRKKQKEKDEWNQPLKLDSNVLDTGSGGIFSGILQLVGKRRKRAFDGDRIGGNAGVFNFYKPVHGAVAFHNIFEDRKQKYNGPSVDFGVKDGTRRLSAFSDISR